MRTLSLCVALLAASPAQAERFEIVPGKPNLVRFESRAPLESFEGKTEQVRGEIEVSFDTLAAMSVRVEVDMASLDTGIAIRNRHMRDNHLHTGKFPRAVFRGGTVTGASALAPGGTARFALAGTLELHGVQKPVEAAVEMTRGTAGLQITARFSVKLPDFEIPRPKFLVMQLDEVQRVSVFLVATRAGKN